MMVTIFYGPGWLCAIKRTMFHDFARTCMSPNTLDLYASEHPCTELHSIFRNALMS